MIFGNNYNLSVLLLMLALLIIDIDDIGWSD